MMMEEVVAVVVPIVVEVPMVVEVVATVVEEILSVVLRYIQSGDGGDACGASPINSGGGNGNVLIIVMEVVR